METQEESILWQWKDDANGMHYEKPVRVIEETAMTALKAMFPEGEANPQNFVLFSTSGIHGGYSQIEDIEEGLTESVTFLIVHPRKVTMRYGNVTPDGPDDIVYLKKLRQSSWDAVSQIGNQKAETSPEK